MFDALSDRFEGIFGKLRGKGRLSEDDIDEVLREIRLALLEADVNFEVVKGFQDRVKQRCVGADIHKALNPSQQVIKFVHDELVNTLGGETMQLTFASKPPTVVLLAGLQGAGKTTNAAKLALWFKSQGRNPILIGADLQVFSEPSDPVEVARAGMQEATRLGRDVVICDTAGRLAIDEPLMAEVRSISDAIEPHYTFLVIDAMTGQDAVTVAESFHERLELDGVILTKLDGDARGGAALSVKEVVGRPIAFASTGERLEDFEPFHPDRLASRILGMGDMLTLIEKAEGVYDEAEAEEVAAKLLEGQFTLEDFLVQMQQLKKMGPLQNLVGLMPGMPKEVKDAEIDDGHLARVEAMITSMTAQERETPAIIDGSRRNRIATGSGTSPGEISQLLKQFKEVQKLMKSMGGLGTKRIKKKTKKANKAKKRGGRVTDSKKAKARVPSTLQLPQLDDKGELDLSAFGDFSGPGR